MYVVHIELGPVSSASAQAWISYATDVLAVLRAVPEQHLPRPALDVFASLLDEWRPIAQRPIPFRWSSEQQPERVQYLLNALYVAGTLIEREAASGRAHLRPAAADEFHVLLVRETLDALERESEADAQFVEQMRNIWRIARPD
ncbi:MAG: hypothetical protein ACLPVY_07060 [Acidimicrobiia bacterium]